ncbi:MMPL family transporter [Kordia sp.]|uniref:efflux RND transporter permease subunit n=1 Tax=Kordia sp. TaxID=1965332 RepID=UPI0025C56728|nr:MMPL family transporter [Kordia sp.]MCH2193528.1 MMPL family transporter [Kordia sp.]
MKNMLNPVSRFISKIPEKVLKRKWLYLGFFVAATVFLIMNLGNLKMDMTIEGWIQDDDPTKIAFNEYHAQFGSEDGVYIVYKPKDGDVFSEKSLQVVKSIQEDLLNYKETLRIGQKSALDHIVKVNTVVNARVLTAENDFLYARPLVGENVPKSQAKRDELREIAKGEKQFPLQYFSDDMQYGGIYIETNFGAIPIGEEELNVDDLVLSDTNSDLTLEETATNAATPRFKPTDQADYLKLNEAINEILNKPEYAEHFQYYAVGNTPAAEYDLLMVDEMSDLYMGALLIMIVLLWYFFRRFSAVTWSLTIVILSTIWTFGISALLGLTVTGFLILTVLLILTVGIADSVHIMSGYSFLRNTNTDHKTSLKTIYGTVGTALLLTATTNMVGIIALNITPVVPIQTFAIMSTIGISLAFLFTIFLLPILMDIWKPWKKTDESKSSKSFLARLFPNFAVIMQRILAKVVPLVERRPIPILVIFFGIIAFCIYGSTLVTVNSNMLDQYPDDSKFRENVEIADNKMMGAYSMVVFLDLGKENAFKDPKVLKSMDKLQRKFEKKYEKYVVMTSSLADVAKDAYKKLNEGKDEKYIIPENPQILSQTLFMFNNASPEDRKRLVGDNYQKANIKISLHNYGSYEYSKVFENMQTDIAEMVNNLKQNYSEATVSITGIFALAMQTADYLTKNEVNSFGIALIAICIILLIVFGSAKVGAAAMFPNLLPAILTFGLLGVLGIPLDFYTMMLAPIIIGISVDDTVTFITQYRHEVIKDGNIKRALRYTMQEAGQALLFTSLVLGLGFGIMSVAAAAGTSNMGRFGFIAIMAGLMCDLFFLPALIIVFKLNFGAKKQTPDEEVEEETVTHLKEEVHEVV